MPKKLNEAQGIGQRVILWNRAQKDFVPVLCVVCQQIKQVKRSTALVWRSNKDAPACCARTAPHLVERIHKLEIVIGRARALLDIEPIDVPRVKEILASAKESGS